MLRLKWLLIGIGAAFAGIGLCWIWLAFFHPNAAAVGSRLSDAIQDKLHARPTVYLQKYVVVEEKRPIAELALVSRATDVEHRMDSDLLLSKARLIVRAAFNVKAGFDLRSPGFALRLDSTLKRARLDMPPPRVLSLEMTRYDIVEDRDGWWNKISSTDRELGMRQMQADAKLEAIKAGILKECKSEMEKDLADVPRLTGVALEFHYLHGAEAGGGNDSASVSSPELVPLQ